MNQEFPRKLCSNLSRNNPSFFFKKWQKVNGVIPNLTSFVGNVGFAEYKGTRDVWGYLKQIIEGRVVVSKASDGLSGFDFNGKYVSVVFD